MRKSSFLQGEIGAILLTELTFLYTAPTMAVRSLIPVTKHTWKYRCRTSVCTQVHMKSRAV